MLSMLFLIVAILTMACGALGLYCLRNQGASLLVRRWSEVTSWIALGSGTLFGAQVLFNQNHLYTEYFFLSSLQAILVPYMLIMGVLVKRFAYHYLQSDTDYPKFFLKIKLLLCALLTLLVSNHAVLLALTWIASGWIMYLLISHTKTEASKQSGKLAIATFILGDIALLVGVCGLVSQTNSFNLDAWPGLYSDAMLPWLLCITIAAFSKTAIIPFHQWLTHSLTAPTPVSAIMHAGFVNSGAVLLAKMSSLFVQAPLVMSTVFVIGLISALMGSLAMLVQTDVKRYLTFSTIGQMGFMMMECGLGAFHLAILHLIVHGLFKARLFLSSGTVIEHRQAIRNVKHRQKSGVEGKPSAWIFAMSMFIFSLAIWALLLGIPGIQNHLLGIPLILLIILALSTLFVQTVLLKAKGTGFKGVSVAMLLNSCLVLLYISYESVAQAFFPDLNLINFKTYMPLYNISGIILGVFGVVIWLCQLNLLPVPSLVRNASYVFLLNSAGTFKSGSTFSNRACTTSV